MEKRTLDIMGGGVKGALAPLNEYIYIVEMVKVLI